uniref:(northern house mosquito) hypothetical protein n=1 Tax=Culex pipiens TaxID=7175 RepID=A0A8D8FVA3_CULPI
MVRTAIMIILLKNQPIQAAIRKITLEKQPTPPPPLKKLVRHQRRRCLLRPPISRRHQTRRLLVLAAPPPSFHNQVILIFICITIKTYQTITPNTFIINTNTTPTTNKPEPVRRP